MRINRGYHEYEPIWSEPTVGEEEGERENEEEREGFAESGNGNQMLLLLCHSWTHQHNNADKILKTCTIT